MRYYVVADTHGYYTYLEQALREAGFFDDTEPHKLILCGDLLDRGGEANRLVDFTVDLLDRGMLIFVLGNHEDLFIQCLQEISRSGGREISGHHYHNGTWDTMLQISGMSKEAANRMPSELIHRVMESPFYRRLLLAGVDYFETPNYIFTHGWIPCITEGVIPYDGYSYDPNWRNADTAEWRKARWFNGMNVACNYHVTVPDKTVVCGHWHASYGHANIEHKGSERGEDADFSPFYADGIIAIDASTPLTQRVNCIVIED